MSSQLSVEEWTTTETAALDRCGHCDNCTRAPGSVSRIDLRLPAWQTLKAAEAVEGHGSRLTLRQLGGIVRGLGHGKVTVSKTRRRRAEQSATIDMEEIAGGKVLLAKEVRTRGRALAPLSLSLSACVCPHSRGRHAPLHRRTRRCSASTS